MAIKVTHDKVYLFVKLVVKTEYAQINDAVKEMENLSTIVYTDQGATLTFSNTKKVKLTSCELLKIYNKHDK